MSDSVAELSVAQLQRLLDQKKERLDILRKRRERLRLELDDVDRQIAELNGNVRGGGTGRRSRRMLNDRPLSAYVRDYVGRSQNGLTLSELTQKILDSGYKTTSGDFRNVVYQCVYNLDDVVHDEVTRTYRLKEDVQRAHSR